MITAQWTFPQIYMFVVELVARRYIEIDRANRILLQKMSDIMRKPVYEIRSGVRSSMRPVFAHVEAGFEGAGNLNRSS